MANRDYPRLGQWRAPKQTSGRKCVVCGAMPAGFTDVQVSWFRGEDERVATCKAHRSSAAALDAWEKSGAPSASERAGREDHADK